MKERGRRGSAWRASAALLLSVLPLPQGSVFAGGPLMVGGPGMGIAGVPFVWDNSVPIAYRVDGGPLSQQPSGGPVVIDNATGVTRVNGMFMNWSAVPTANLTITNVGGILPVGSFTGGDVKTVQDFLSVAGDYIPTFTVKDSKGAMASANLELVIVAPLTFVSSGGALPDGNIAVGYFTYLLVQGGLPPYTYSLVPGSNPLAPGLALDSGHEALTGIPTTPGSYSFAVQVTDSFTPPFKISQSYTLRILNNLVVPNLNLPIGVRNAAYSEAVQTAGGTPPYQYSITGQFSQVPPGLTLDSSTGTIHGTPTTAGTYAFFVQVTDSGSPPATITAEQFLQINPPLAFQTTTLPDFARGLDYGALGAFIFMVGGRPPLSAQVITGALPNGLSITSFNGIAFSVSGIPTKDGLFQFTVQVSDSYAPPNTAQQNFQIRISDPLVISGPQAVQILEGQSYSTTFPVAGGFPPYTWAASQIPPGFMFDTTTGTLSGTATGAGFTSPFITVHDSSSPPLTTSFALFSLQVFGKLQIATSFWPPIANGGTVWLTPEVTGGIAPYTWSVTAGSLPTGMKFSTTDGTISGAPTLSGTYPLTLAVADGNTGSLAQATSRQLMLIVKDRGQFTRNDAIAQATPISNGSIVASVSPYSDPSTSGPDVDVYQVTASPGTLVDVYVAANIDALQPPNPNSLLPLIEVVDGSGTRYQTCSAQRNLTSGPYNLPCVNGLDGHFFSSAFYAFLVPGSGTTPLTFYLRVSDARGDARPDFVYTLGVSGLN